MGSILTREIDLRLTPGRRIAAILAFGVVCRVGQYLADRPFWLDEDSLASNIVGRPIFGRWERPTGVQVFPLGFITIERALAQALGDSTYALRLFPLLCGVGALFLFLAVARHCLDPRAVPVALALFAVSDDLIYYASELKQYSTDVAAALAAYLIAIEARRAPPTPRRVAALGALGAAIVWLSHPSVFVLAGVGIYLLGSALIGRRRREAVAAAVLGVVWASSFAASYLTTPVTIAEEGSLWVFWAFAFLPMPPTSASDAAWAPRAVLNLFIDTIGFPSPLGSRGPAVVAFALSLVGCLSFWRRRRGWLVMLLAPLFLAMLASGLKLYPFHGRLLLFLVPSLLLLIAEGVQAVGARLGRGPIYGLLLAILLLFPTLYALLHLAEPRHRAFFNPVGDYRPHDESF